ncbi:TIGR04255 family protein [Synechococcus sp. CCAP 1479/9]|uniref:TIGR04255 family protein n=1 Tax=Synechococcus sp. CCAP 1479/9 TaxID=1221593 RepID=UPI001C21D103|nr:TIGR04255 family protein [Synechococcus sp. CCAP 1479/9]
MVATSSPRWRDPPLQEAVFELFFPAVSDYSLFVGNIFNSLKEEYPTSLALPANDFPLIPSLPGFVRHRFSDTSGAVLFQLGQDLLTVNCLSYTSFNDYSQHIHDVLSAVLEHGAPFGLSQLTRLGIRYINRFENTDDPVAILQIGLPFPSSEADKLNNLKVHDTRQLGSNDGGRYLVRSFDFAADERLLLLDLQVYQVFNTQHDLAIDELMKWAKDAHDTISNNFESLVLNDVKERRK